MKYPVQIQEKFDLYSQILRTWQSKMNLVAPSTLNDVQRRHIDDSAQLADYLPKNVTVLDMGSGAGFPSVVLAILGWQVIAIESIRKKTIFLEEVKSKLNLKNLKIINDRVENYLKQIKNSEKETIIFTARAFAPLINILDYIAAFASSAYLLKGAGIQQEIITAQEKYNFNYTLFPSTTGDGFIIKIDHLRPRRK
ncbi:MAG: 16S rRNA (guanine(527)-N(7))-methyltransferase RsmG [Alphaproteobacteria bacterium]